MDNDKYADQFQVKDRTPETHAGNQPGSEKTGVQKFSDERPANQQPNGQSTPDGPDQDSDDGDMEGDEADQDTVEGDEADDDTGEGDDGAAGSGE